MKMTTELATLAEAEEDIDDDDEDGDDDEDDNHDEGSSSSEICAFDVPHFRYIDDDNVEDNKREERKRERAGGWKDGTDRTWCSSEEDCCGPSSYRYVVVSGTPLKILEHLLSDLRLDDQRGAPESRESGKFGDAHTTHVLQTLTFHNHCIHRQSERHRSGCVSI